MGKKRLEVILLAAWMFYLAAYALADWSPARRLTWTAGDSRFPAIAMDSSDTVHVVWEDDTPGNWEIYYKKSTDSGTSWSAARRLTWTLGDSHRPAMAIDSSDIIHVFWDDDTPGGMEIYYKRSSNGGASWGAAQRLTWTSGSSYDTAVAIDSSDAIHIAWYGYSPGVPEIYYKRSPDGGATWNPVKRLTWTSGNSYVPAIATDSSNAIHIVWEDETPGIAEIYYRQSPDGGSNWNSAKRLTWTSGGSYMPVIAADSSDTIHVAWYDHTAGNLEIYYKRSEDGGSTWGPAQRLTWTSGGSRYIAIAVEANAIIHIAWYDDTPGASEIYYKRSTDGGSTWSVAQRLTWTSDSSSYPAMAIDSGSNIHLVWEDMTPANWEIYYKKGT
jgi:hypothetical protein